MSNTRTVSRNTTSTSTIDTVDQWKHSGGEVDSEKITRFRQALRTDHRRVSRHANVPGVKRVNISNLNLNRESCTNGESIHVSRRDVQCARSVCGMNRVYRDAQGCDQYQRQKFSNNF